MILSDDEMILLTKCRRYKAQARRLEAMGIDYLIRPDGSLAVLKAHVEARMGLTHPVQRGTRTRVEFELEPVSA